MKWLLYIIRWHTGNLQCT